VQELVQVFSLGLVLDLCILQSELSHQISLVQDESIGSLLALSCSPSSDLDLLLCKFLGGFPDEQIDQEVSIEASRSMSISGTTPRIITELFHHPGLIPGVFWKLLPGGQSFRSDPGGNGMLLDKMPACLRSTSAKDMSRLVQVELVFLVHSVIIMVIKRCNLAGNSFYYQFLECNKPSTLIAS
jgi:hypothetical protein